LLSQTRILEVSNHEQPTEDSPRDRSFAGDRRGSRERVVERGFNVVANSRKVTQSTEVAAADHVALVDGTAALHELFPGGALRQLPASLSAFDVLVFDGQAVKKVAKRLKPLRGVGGGSGVSGTSAA